MKRTVVLVLVLVALLHACGHGERSPGDLYVNKDQHYSIEKPQGWDVTMVRGSAQLAPTSANANKSKHTIVVRAADKPREVNEGKATTLDDVYAATEKVLRALPGATVGERTPLNDAELQGAAYSITFTPRGLLAKYHRDHAVLVGSKHVYHVIYTAPDGEGVDQAALNKVVATLSEEG